MAPENRADLNLPDYIYGLAIEGVKRGKSARHTGFIIADEIGLKMIALPVHQNGGIAIQTQNQAVIACADTGGIAGGGVGAAIGLIDARGGDVQVGRGVAAVEAGDADILVAMHRIQTDMNGDAAGIDLIDHIEFVAAAIAVKITGAGHGLAGTAEGAEIGRQGSGTCQIGDQHAARDQSGQKTSQHNRSHTHFPHL